MSVRINEGFFDSKIDSTSLVCDLTCTEEVQRVKGQVRTCSKYAISTLDLCFVAATDMVMMIENTRASKKKHVDQQQAFDNFLFAIDSNSESNVRAVASST